MIAFALYNSFPINSCLFLWISIDLALLDCRISRVAINPKKGEHDDRKKDSVELISFPAECPSN